MISLLLPGMIWLLLFGLMVSLLLFGRLVHKVGYAQAVLAALERLEQAGVADEDVTLVSVVISKEAVETLTEEAGDMRVVRRGNPCHSCTVLKV